VDGARRDVAFKALLHILQNRASVGLVTQADDGDEYRLLEGSQGIRHVAYIVGIKRCLSR
jgi:hypothetical protein